MNTQMENTISPESALRRKKTAPYLVLLGASGAGKSTLLFLLLGEVLSRYLRIGIGDKSQTTIIPLELCGDSRIANERRIAVQIIRKDFSGEEIHESVMSVMGELFGKNEADTDKTLFALEDEEYRKIIRPENAAYHLEKLADLFPPERFQEAFRPILDRMAKMDFLSLVRQRKSELKKKSRLGEIRQMIFEELYQKIDKETKKPYQEWLRHIEESIIERLKKSVGEELLSENIVEYFVEEDSDTEKILTALFTPDEPYSLILDRIVIACRPRQELIDIALGKDKKIPLRFCIRDTMGLTQKNIDAVSIREAMETALNCKADAILFLMNLTERDDALAECCRALADKQEELRNRHLNKPVHVLFTKADAIVENLIEKCKTGIYTELSDYTQNIQDVLQKVETTIYSYVGRIQEADADWLSMRYKQDSNLLTSLNGDPRQKNFKPEGLFEKIVEISINTLMRMLPQNMTRPVFVTAVNPDEPAIRISVNQDKIMPLLKDMQNSLTQNISIVNEYLIKDECRIHGRSVTNYWRNLTKGLGYRTHANVYGNFKINMKGLLRRILQSYFSDFGKLDTENAVSVTADNLCDKDLQNLIKKMFPDADLKTGMDPVIGEKNICLQRLYEFYRAYFSQQKVFANMTEIAAYDLSYRNKTVKAYLTKIYTQNLINHGYDRTIRTLQEEFRAFFESDEFLDIFISEWSDIMTEIVNKMLIII